MTIDSIVNTGRFQVAFPLWLEEICPVQAAISYVSKECTGYNDVDDILNTALARLNNAKCQGVPISRQYVFATFKNLVRDRYRKLKSEHEQRNKSEELQLNRDSNEGVSKNSNTDERSEWALEAISQLDLRRRVIAKLRFHKPHKFTFKEIGDIIGYSESTARMEFNNTREIIKSYVNAKTSAQSN